MLIRTFVLKVINDEIKKLTHHKIIDRIAKQTPLVIIQVRKNRRFIQLTEATFLIYLFIYIHRQMFCKIGFA